MKTLVCLLILLMSAFAWGQCSSDPNNPLVMGTVSFDYGVTGRAFGWDITFTDPDANIIEPNNLTIKVFRGPAWASLSTGFAVDPNVNTSFVPCDAGPWLAAEARAKMWTLSCGIPNNIPAGVYPIVIESTDGSPGNARYWAINVYIVNRRPPFWSSGRRR